MLIFSTVVFEISLAAPEVSGEQRFSLIEIGDIRHITAADLSLQSFSDKDIDIT